VNRSKGKVPQERVRGAEEKGTEGHRRWGGRDEGEGGGDGTRGLDEKGW